MRTLKIVKTYLEAEAHCSNIGGHVLALETQKESTDVWKMFTAPRGWYHEADCKVSNTKHGKSIS